MVDMDSELKFCYAYNRRLLSHYSKSFYLATRLLPRFKQRAVFALYGFCRFADNLVDKPRNRTPEEMLNEMRFLEEELKVAFRTGESEHPVICAFVHTALAYGIPLKYPLELIEGVVMDIRHQRYRHFDELLFFCHRVAGVVGLMMTHILGRTDDRAFEYADRLGIAMQLTNILRDIREDKNNGRIYLPLDEMKRFHVRENDIIQEKYTDALNALMRFSVQRAHRYYEEALPGIDMLTRNCRFAIRASSDIYRKILDEIAANDYNPFLGRVYVTQARKMRIIMSGYIRSKINWNQSAV